MDVESFYLGETCFLRVLSRIISVTAISAGICITRLTANLYVPAYSFLSDINSVINYIYKAYTYIHIS